MVTGSYPIINRVLTTTNNVFYVNASCTPFVLFLIVVSAVGQSCVYTASSEILGHHFKRHLYLATATVILGFFVGFMVFPILSQYLVSHYGYNSGMAMMGGMQAVHLLNGIVYTETKLHDHHHNHTGETTSSEGDEKLDSVSTTSTVDPSGDEEKISDEPDSQEEEEERSSRQQQHRLSTIQKLLGLAKSIRVSHCY